MSDRATYGCPAERRRSPASRWTSPAAAVVMAAGMVGLWACGGGGAGGGGVAAQSLLPGAPARDAAPAAAPAPPPSETPAAPRFSPRTLAELDRALAAAVAAADEAEREEEARRVEAERSARSGFPVSERMEMSATMYCLRGAMRTGVRTRDGMAAGDPRVLPLGSVVRVSHPDGRPVGIFVIMDTGGAVKGNKIDIYVDSCAEARRWGRRPVVTEVLATGRASPGDLR